MTTSMPSVSFVIPTHDRPGYLRDSVRSIRSQQMEALEIIVVDDGSEEPARQLFEHDPFFSDVVWRRHDRARGPGCARRTGVDAASGRYIGFVDDDDVLEPHYLETAVAVLDANPPVGLFCCDATLIDPSGATVQGGRTFNSINAAIKRYPLVSGLRTLGEIFEFPTLGMGFLVRRAVFDRVAYPAGRRLEDYEFQLDVAASGFGVYYCHQPLARYRLHRGNASSHCGLAAMAEQVVVSIRRAVEHYPVLREAPGRIRRRAADAETDLGIARLREGQVLRGFASLSRAVAGDPRRAMDLARIAWRQAVRRTRRARPLSNVASSSR